MTCELRLIALMLFLAPIPVTAGAGGYAQRLLDDATYGDVAACYNLGVMYHKGIDVPKNNQEAEIWLNKAYKRGDLNAMKVLQEIQKERRNYVPPKNCLSWFDGCNQCDIESGCTKLGCTELKEPKCLSLKE